MAVFEDRVIIVTGASEGIGRALCLALAPQKTKLVLAARNESRLLGLAEDCRRAGADALVVPTDVTDEQACKILIERSVDQYGKIDVLVNNAGTTMWSLFEEVQDFSIFEQIMRLNYFGALYCTRYALPYLRQTRGRIAAVASVAGFTGVPTRSGYSASKYAMFGFFESLRIELAGSGISVTLIAPDFIQSEIHRRALGGDGQALMKSPLQKNNIMSAQACAEMIVKAMEQRRRLLITSFRGRLGRWLKLLAPGLVDRIAKSAIDKRK